MDSEMTHNSNVLITPNFSKFIEDLPMEQDKSENITINNSSMQTYSKIVCCICGASIEANSRGICPTCEKKNIDITNGITKTGIIHFCKNCNRYLRPPWIKCEKESQDMMNLCLSKIKGLNKIKIIDSSFIWTEPHSKLIKIKITIQKEIDKVLASTSFIVEFKEEWIQCEDCAKTFTPHIWKSSVQIRQKVDHKRTFLYLEQLILKHKTYTKAISIKEQSEGVDFYFSNKSQGNSFSSFIQSCLPCKTKQSRQLISVDEKSNVAEYKDTILIEIAPVCQDDLIILNEEQYKKLGGIGPILLCFKQANTLHFIDPISFEMKELDSNTYWRYELKSYVNRSCMSEFLILSCEEEINYKKLSNENSKMDIDNINKSNNKGKNNENSIYENIHQNKINEKKFKIVNVKCIKNLSKNDDEIVEIRTFLGRKMHPGDIYLGYDLREINLSEDLELNLKKKTEKIPDVILVKKKYKNYRRIFKLKHLNMEVDERNKKDKNRKNQRKKDEEDFMEEIGENKELREEIDLYRDEKAIQELEKRISNLGIEEKDLNDSDLAIDLNALKLDDGEDIISPNNKNINNKADDDEEYDDGFKKPKTKGNKKKNKQIGKRERNGEHLDDE